MVHLELLGDSAEPIWDEMVGQFEEGSVFHTWAWQVATERWRGSEWLPYGVFDGDDLVGVFPLMRAKRGPLTVLASPLGALGYGGPLIRPEHRETVMDQLESILKDLQADYVEIRLVRGWESALLAGNNYTVDTFHTVVLGLERSVDELWANLRANCRTAVRKARKQHVEIVEATDQSFLSPYCRMSVDTYAKSGRPRPVSQEAYSVVWEALRPQGRIKVLLAKHGDRVVAGCIFLVFRDRLYYWDGASYRADYPLCPNDLIHWTIVEWGATHQFKEYDMLGANIPSIAVFKLKFGGELTPYLYATRDVTWRSQLGRRLYRRVAPGLRLLKGRLEGAFAHRGARRDANA